MSTTKHTMVDRICPVCQKTFKARLAQVKIGWGIFCSKFCAAAFQRIPLADAFNRKVGEPTATGCRLWLGSKNPQGYGQFRYRGRQDTQLSAHRVAWELANGPVPDGLFVCHKCDVRACVEVSHLWLGTCKENLQDCVAKGRNARGERNGQSKLTEEKVLLILDRFSAGNVTKTSLATEFGVSASLIAQIVQRKAWKHVA